MRLVGKIIAPSVAARAFANLEDFRIPLGWLASNQVADISLAAAAVTIIRFALTAAVADSENSPGSYYLRGTNAPPWMLLVEHLTSVRLADLRGPVRMLLAQLRNEGPALIDEQASSANLAARRLLEGTLDDDNLFGDLRVAIDATLRTISAAPAESVALLRNFLKSEQVDRVGYESLRHITEHMIQLSQFDQDFVADLVDVSFRAKANREDQVPSGGRILNMTFNKHDMLDHARYEIARRYPKLCTSYPQLATRIYVIVMRAVLESEHPETSNPRHHGVFSFRGVEAKYRPDGSYIWTAGSHNETAHWWKIREAFISLICELANGEQPHQLDQVLQVLADENELAVVWNTLLIAAQRDSAAMWPYVKELLWATPILMQLETSHAAAELLKTIYSFLESTERAQIEKVILELAYDDGDGTNEIAQRRSDRLLGCLPVESIVTPEARSRREALNVEGGPPPNERPFEMSGFRQISHEEWLRDHGVKIDEPQNQEIHELRNGVSNWKPHGDDPKSLRQQIADFVPKLRQLLHLCTATVEPPIDSQLVEDAQPFVSAGCERIASSGGLRRDDKEFPFVKEQLLAASESSDPEVREDLNDSWDKSSPGWSWPSPRVVAAEGLTELATDEATRDEELLAAVERLALDSHPAVRYQVIVRLLKFWDVDREFLWRHIERVAATEERLGILDFFIGGPIWGLPRADAPRALSYVRQIQERIAGRENTDRLRSQIARCYLRATLFVEDTDALAELERYLEDPHAFVPELTAIIVSSRDLLSNSSDEGSPDESSRYRTWAVDYLTRLTTKLSTEAIALRQEASALGGSEWPEPLVERYRSILILAHDIATQLYFGSGAYDDKNRERIIQDDEELQTARAFLKDSHELLDALSNLGFVESAWDVLKTLEYLLPADPTSVFQLVAKQIRVSSEHGIQYESMALDLVAAIVERCIVDFRRLFREDHELQQALLDSLDSFVNAGWPRAVQLTYKLGEIWR